MVTVRQHLRQYLLFLRRLLQHKSSSVFFVAPEEAAASRGVTCKKNMSEIEFGPGLLESNSVLKVIFCFLTNRSVKNIVSGHASGEMQDRCLKPSNSTRLKEINWAGSSSHTMQSLRGLRLCEVKRCWMCNTSPSVVLKRLVSGDQLQMCLPAARGLTLYSITVQGSEPVPAALWHLCRCPRFWNLSRPREPENFF